MRQHERHLFRTITVFLGFVLLTTSAVSAAVFTVTLENGSSFDTRYRPVEAEWDASFMLIMTDQGNLIALQKDEVADVTSDFEAQGFGFQLDTSTVMLGYTANNAATDAEGGPGGPGGAGGAGGVDGLAPLNSGQPSQESFSVEQFVNTDTAGAGGGVDLDAIY
ncbi:MAG: hypothetical protein AAGD38_02875 [Acidobacteriota bacterium]